MNFLHRIICVLEILYISACVHTHTLSIKNELCTSFSHHCEICIQMLYNLRKKNITKYNKEHVFERCCLSMRATGNVLQHILYVSQNQKEISAIFYVAN